MGNAGLDSIKAALMELGSVYEKQGKALAICTKDRLCGVSVFNEIVTMAVVEFKSEYNTLVLKDNKGELVAIVQQVVNDNGKLKVVKKALAEDFIATQAGKALYLAAQQHEQKLKKSGKHIIYTSEIDIDAVLKDLQTLSEEERQEMGVDLSDKESVHQYALDCNNTWFSDEKLNLPKDKLNIVAIASLGLWNGRRAAYAEYTCSISELMDKLWARSIEDVEFYVEGNDLQADLHHHDGTNHITYREVTNMKGWKRVAQKLYNNELVTREELTACTKSLRPRVNAVYGW